MGADSNTPVGLLSDLLEHHAETTPEAVAITDGRSRLTWSEYRDAAAALAGELAAAGVRPGDRVGVHLPKSVGSFVAVHAVLRIGAVMVPVDWFAPPAYVADVLDDAGVRALVTSARGPRLDAVRGAAEIVVPADGDRSAGSAGVARIASDEPAYIIYTSGSTGRPKGIVHTHASALAYARLACDTYVLTADDRLVNIAPLHFDQSTFELYAAPLAGAAVLVVPDAMMRFPASLSELVADERATVWYSVPTAIRQLIARGALAERDMSALRWVLFGGEVFPPASLADAMRALPAARFSNVYGPAEVNQCTFQHLDRPPTTDDPIPIGRAWDGVQLRIVDGELWVAAPTMMREYWNRPDLTDAAIVVGDDGRRWYRTGDRVRELPDGALVFAGRTDHQVKVRGHRIELEAIEAVLADHPAVEACVAIVDRAGDDDVLVAVVTPPLADDAESDLMARVRAKLPRWAIPDEIVGTDHLPLTGTGKVDRNATSNALERLRGAHTAHPPGDLAS